MKQLFRSHGLRITIEPPNLMVVNFLDVKLNLETGTHYPYRKPNHRPKYVHALSDYPPHTVVKGIPLSVNKRHQQGIVVVGAANREVKISTSQSGQ